MARGNPKPRLENLKPITGLSHEEAKKLGKLGGIKSVQVRREKKLLSQIYGEILSDKLGLDGNGKTMKDLAREILTGSPLIYTPSVKVSLMKEIREATEGSKVHNTGEMDNNITIKFE
jgi:hypothetical protein